MEGQIKEREGSRIRATITLVQEMFNASRTGRPVSIEAIKGFITAWLFPRAVIVIGSLAGVILLGLQTYILWNQTKVLSLQTRAAQIEQASSLRLRLSSNNIIITHLRELISAHKKEPIIPVQCNDDLCGQISSRDALLSLGEENTNPLIPSNLSAAWLNLAEQLHSIQGSVYIASPYGEFDDVELAENWIGVVRETLRPAITSCLFDATKSRKLLDASTAYNSLTKAGEAFIETKNSKTDLKKATKNLERKIKAVRYSVENESEEYFNSTTKELVYTYFSFIKDVDALQSSYFSLLDALYDACQSQIAIDSADLKTMEASLN